MCTLDLNGACAHQQQGRARAARTAAFSRHLQVISPSRSRPSRSCHRIPMSLTAYAPTATSHHHHHHASHPPRENNRLVLSRASQWRRRESCQPALPRGRSCRKEKNLDPSGTAILHPIISDSPRARDRAGASPSRRPPSTVAQVDPSRKPLPTVEAPQPEDLPARDFQSVSERFVSLSPVLKSRHTQRSPILPFKPAVWSALIAYAAVFWRNPSPDHARDG